MSSEVAMLCQQLVVVEMLYVLGPCVDGIHGSIHPFSRAIAQVLLVNAPNGRKS